jgi:Glycosyl hydrolases family 18
LLSLAESRPRLGRPAPAAGVSTPRSRNIGRRRGALLGVAFAALCATAVAYGQASQSVVPAPAAAASAAGQAGDGNASSALRGLGNPATLGLSPATSSPIPVGAAVADAPPLRPHEVFAFAPYWALGQSGGFDYKGLTTLAYFSVDVNANGTLDETGSTWAGYESEALVDMISRAHAAGDRVVLSVTDFDQGSLDALTSLPTAPATLGSALVQAIGAKDLDGVNLDFEGDGSADQAGLTNLVRTVSVLVHQANPHYQVTMDTYASSAAGTDGFYNLPALAPSVDGFFVMAYQLNLAAGPAGVASSMTRSMFANQTTAQEYDTAVPPGKVILGLPFFGYDWPTTDGTLDAAALGGPSTINADQASTSGHPRYWDAVTDTAWTSYQVDGQWHESFYEDPTSLYLATQLAQREKLGGVGIWTLGSGSDDDAMVSALDGHAPSVKDSLAGPTSTTASGAGGASGPNAGGSRGAAPPVAGSAPDAPPVNPDGPGFPSPAPSTTTTTAAPAVPRNFSYGGKWDGSTVTLRLAAHVTSSSARAVGTLSGFTTDNPALTCLAGDAKLTVWQDSSSGQNLYVVAATPGDCATQTFVFAAPPVQSTTTTTS